MDLLEQKSFLKSIPPFDKLDSIDIEKVVEKFDIVYFKENETVLDTTLRAEFLYFIIKGVVKELDNGKAIGLYSNNEFFDTVSLIEGRVKYSYITTTETICYRLEKEFFLDTIYKNSELESYFFQSISKKLNQNLVNENSKELVNFMVAKVKDAYLRNASFLDANTSVYEAVLKMQKEKSSYVLIRHTHNYGLVTDSDFKNRVILQKLDFNSPIHKIATFDLITVDEDEFLFNAQLQMTRHGIKRLIVVDKNKTVIGVIDQISIASYFASHTYRVTYKIDLASNIEELKEASDSFIQVIKALFAKGVKVRYISKLISELNTKLFQKLFILIAPKELYEKSALIVMGSEGRGEQILKTDQDNALILANDIEISKEKLQEFTDKFNTLLCQLGYPKCPGNIMITNSYWNKPLKEFKESIFEWIDRGAEEDMMNLAIFYDAKFIVGDEKLLEELKRYIYSTLENFSSFLPPFSKSVLSFETPLSFFTEFVVDKQKHKNELDIKKGGIFTIVQGVRALSLEHKLQTTNSVERIKELNNKNIIDREFASELIESFNFLLTVKLKSQLEKLENGLIVDNYINPSKLNRLEKDLLKDSLKIVDKFKKFLTYHYKLNMV